jgi:hypothetical protein
VCSQQSGGFLEPQFPVEEATVDLLDGPRQIAHSLLGLPNTAISSEACAAA